MKLQKIAIDNFRSFNEFELELSGESVFLIGENGGGKSTFLQAVVRGLGRDLNFTRADFAEETRALRIELTLDDLDLDQQALFSDYLDFGSGLPQLRLLVRALWDAASEQIEIEHTYPRTGSRSRRNERDALKHDWLPAQRDAARMLAFGSARNLMARLLADLPLDQSLDQALDDVRAAAEQLGRDQDLVGLLTRARDALAGLLPEVGADAFSLGLAGTTARELLGQFELDVSYGGDAVPVGRQATGVAQLALFVFVIELVRQEPGTLVLVDEPEVSLHPQAQRALMRALTSLDGQLIIATHSANLLDRADPRRVARLSRAGASVTVARPHALSDDDARRLARFTSPQTAEAFFARAVILVEGLSDQLALEALAERRGRNLDGEGISIVPVGGVKTMRAYLHLFGPQGFDLPVAGLCDEAEEGDVARALETAGLGVNLDRAGMEALGFYVCVVDLEDELIRALGVADVEQLVDEQGDLPAFQLLKQQPKYRTEPADVQLRAFIGRRKIDYAPRLVDRLDLVQVPRPFDEVLTRV